MTAIVTIGEHKVPISAAAGALVIYKTQFGSDYVEDYNNIGADETTAIEQYILVGYRLLWCMAKIADPSISAPDDWVKELGDIDLEEPLQKAQELFEECIQRLHDLGDLEGETSEFTVEKFLAYSALCGMTLADLDRLPLSMVLGAIYEYIRFKTGEVEARQATQEDFDNF